MTAAREVGIITLDPTSGALERRDPRGLARRRVTLDGAVVGLVANGLGCAQGFLEAVYEELAKMAELKGAVRVRKKSVSVPPEPAAWERITAEATVGITGFGG